MEHEHLHHKHGDAPAVKHPLRDYLPLAFVFAVVVVVTFVLDATLFSFERFVVMRTFMGVFFLVFGSFKAVRMRAFADAYQEYDLLAKRSRAYAYAYPFVELSLGYSYLFASDLVLTNVVTIIVMSVSALGVYTKLRLREPVVCACLGTLFKIPMTWVTLSEDLLMATMAAVMLLA